MKKLPYLLSRITDITFTIEQQYPELYRHLDETPLTIPSGNFPTLDLQLFSDYLDSLQHLLKHHIENQKKLSRHHENTFAHP